MDGDRQTGDDGSTHEIIASPIKVSVTISAGALSVTLHSEIYAGSDDRTLLLNAVIADTAVTAVSTIKAARDALNEPVRPISVPSKEPPHDESESSDSCGR